MSRPTHEAYVEEFRNAAGDLYYIAGCAETLIVADSFTFVARRRAGVEPDELAGDDARNRALARLGDERYLSETSETFCDADHVHAQQGAPEPVEPVEHVEPAVEPVPVDET